VSVTRAETPPLAQIARDGLRVSSPEALGRAAADFQADHAVMLPRLIEPGLLAVIRRELEKADFYDRSHPGIGVELCLGSGPLAGALELVLNDPALFEVVRRIAGCGPIGCFEGRVYRLVPGAGHHDSWHTDSGQTRLLAMTVNLGTGEYRGGRLQIRDAATRRIVYETANVGEGDAVLFRISRALAHRVTPIEGTVAKTALAGWFRAEPDYGELMRRRLGTGRRPLMA